MTGDRDWLQAECMNMEKSHAKENVSVIDYLVGNSLGFGLLAATFSKGGRTGSLE